VATGKEEVESPKFSSSSSSSHKASVQDNQSSAARFGPKPNESNPYLRDLLRQVNRGPALNQVKSLLMP